MIANAHQLPVITPASTNPANEVAKKLTGRDYVSWSAISTFRTCPLKYKFRYIDGPESTNLRSRSGTRARGVTEDGTVGLTCLCTVGRDRNAPNGRARADLDHFLRLGVGLVGFVRAVACESGDLVLDGLLARLVRPLHDRLKTLAVMEQGAVEFSLDGAGG